VGTYQIQYRKIDAAGNPSNIVTRTISVTDQTPPDTSITTGIGSGVLSGTGTQTFSFTSTETGSTFQCRIDGGSYSGCTSPYTYTGLVDGYHTFEVRAIDIASNIDPTPASRSFYIDTTAPTAPNVQAHITGLYTATNPEIIFNGSTDAYFSGYTISADGSAYTIQSSPYYPTLTGSSHIIRVRAYDTIGNFSETVIYYPPVVNIIAPTTLKNSPITNTSIQVVSSSGDIITAITFSGAGNSGFNCGTLPALAPITCTGGSISTSGNLEVTASNGGFTGTTTQAYVIETDRPTAVISLSGSVTDPTSQTVFSLRITTSEALSGSLLGRLVPVNAIISGMSVIDSTNTIFTLTALSD
jgi:hypothetical protein